MCTIFGFEEGEHKKEVYKLINYLANEVKPLLYAPTHTPRRRKESKAFKRQQISGNIPLEQHTVPQAPTFLQIPRGIKNSYKQENYCNV